MNEFDFRNLPEPCPEAYDTVRRRVMGRIRRQRQVRWALRSAMAVAATVLLVWVASLMVRRAPDAAPPPPRLAWRPEPPATPLVMPAAHKRRVRHRFMSTPLLARAEPNAPPLLIKMQTDDPNVVILWMVD